MLDTGGAEWQAMHLARGLAERGHRVTMLALGHVRGPVDRLVDAGVRILSLGAVGPRARLAALPAITRIARGADIVHCTNWDSSFYGRVAALLARRPVVVADHQPDRAFQRSRRGAPRARWVAVHHRLLAPVTAATVACARAQEERLIAEGVPASRLVRIPNGVPIAELRAAAQGGPSRAALGLPEEARVVMHVANFRAQKNHEQTLTTVAELRSDLGDARAVFVGDGPTEAAVRRRVREQGWDWALFLGQRTDVPALMALADVLVLPSWTEALPVVVLEAIALGVPVVAYAVGDTPAVLGQTGGGLCVPAGDGDAFTAACRRVLGEPALAAELSRRGRAGAGAFDVNAMVDRYEQLFDDVLARRDAPRVAHVGPDMWGMGGIPAVLRGLFRSPLAARWRFTFIATYGSATYVDVDRRRRAVMFAGGLVRLVAWCLRPGPRIVHIHTATRGSWYRKSLCIFAVRATRRPVILHIHAGAVDIAAFCDRIGPVRRRLFGRAFRVADRVISVSDAGAREVERRLGVSGIVTMPNAAPMSRVALTPPAGNGRGADVRVLYLGGFANRAKGGEVLLAALPALLADAPDVSVSLAGLGEPEIPDGATDRVRWLGWVDGDSVAAELSATDIVVLPSISEGLPVTLLEACAHGKAVVASRVGGIPEVITDGLDGVLVPARDPVALARALADLATEPERRAQLGRAARARAERLTHDGVYATLDRLYRELASS
jgi:glycosyltransferase involved in cell wall biosynthesis